MAVRSFFYGYDSNFTNEESEKLQADRLIELALFKKPSDISMVRIHPDLDPKDFIRVVVALKKSGGCRPYKLKKLKRFIQSVAVGKQTAYKTQGKLIIKEMEKAHMLKIDNDKIIYA